MERSVSRHVRVDWLLAISDFGRKVMDHSAGRVVPLLLSIKEAAIMLGVCERTVWTLAHERQLPYVQIGRRVLFRHAALESWIAQQEKAR